MNTAAGNQHLPFIAEIWTKEANYPTPAKEDRVQIVTNYEFPFLDMKIIFSPEGDLQFGVFKKKGKQLYYVVQESTHTPCTLRAIPSEVLNCLAKIASGNTPIHSEAVDKIYPNHANVLRKASLAPPTFPRMGDLWRKQDEKVDSDKERDVSKKKTEMSTFVLRTHVTFLRLYTE